MSVFHCTMCGACCEGRGGIILAGRDLARLAAAFGMTGEAFLAEYAEFLHGKYTVRLGDDGRCVFFRAGAGCTVHAVKPDVCRAWPFFRGNMVDGVSLHMAKDFCPGIDKGATHAEFVREGRRYLEENGLVARDPATEGNALLPIDKHPLQGADSMNILIFGPNGSGKGTQGAQMKGAFGLAHIESGAIFREHVGGGTELGMKAKAYMDRGELVPDDITIPMVLETLRTRGAGGWLLDGFPRNIVQARKLDEAMKDTGMRLDTVVEIVLPREIAKNRIMGRRVCQNDGNHSNNIFIDAIKPDGDRCRVCGGALKARVDDQDEAAIDKRHDIYYDTESGTLAAAYYFKALAAERGVAYVELDGRGSIQEVKADLSRKLGLD